MIDLHNRIVKAVNTSPLLAGICMLILNVGSRYISFGFSQTQEAFLRERLGKEILLFAICFTATRNIALSIVLTGSFIVLADYVLNEQSEYCILPSHLQAIKAKIDTNKDGHISKAEFRNAMKALSSLDK